MILALDEVVHSRQVKGHALRQEWQTSRPLDEKLQLSSFSLGEREQCARRAWQKAEHLA